MSTKYKHGDTVPTEVIYKRLVELAGAVADGSAAINRDFTMRVPAELDRDADLVLSEAAHRLQQLQAEKKQLRDALEEAAKTMCAVAADKELGKMWNISTPLKEGYIEIRQLLEETSNEKAK